MRMFSSLLTALITVFFLNGPAAAQDWKMPENYILQVSSATSLFTERMKVISAKFTEEMSELHVELSKAHRTALLELSASDNQNYHKLVVAMQQDDNSRLRMLQENVPAIAAFTKKVRQASKIFLDSQTIARNKFHTAYNEEIRILGATLDNFYEKK